MCGPPDSRLSRGAAAGGGHWLVGEESELQRSPWVPLDARGCGSWPVLTEQLPAPLPDGQEPHYALFGLDDPVLPVWEPNAERLGEAPHHVEHEAEARLA